jgi:hypothetical protein
MERNLILPLCFVYGDSVASTDGIPFWAVIYKTKSAILADMVEKG